MSHYLSKMKVDPSTVASQIKAIQEKQELEKATPEDNINLKKLLLIQKVFNQLIAENLRSKERSEIMSTGTI